MACKKLYICAGVARCLNALNHSDIEGEDAAIEGKLKINTQKSAKVRINKYLSSLRQAASV